MITTKEELRHYLAEDAARYEGRTPSWIDGLFQNEKWYAFQLVKELRYVEYYTNSSHKGLMGGGRRFYSFGINCFINVFAGKLIAI